MAKEVLKYLHTIAFTHRNFEVTKIGLLHVALDEQYTRLNPVKQDFELDELLMLSTCNRVEFSLVSAGEIDAPFLHAFLSAIYPTFDSEFLSSFVLKLEH